MIGKTGEQFVPAQQGEQLFQTQYRPRADPSQGEQRLQGRVRVADLGILKPVAAKQLAFAHDHAHQQCLRRLG